MNLEIFLGLIFLLFWLLCEAICIWLIFSDLKCKDDHLPPVYGCFYGDPPMRPHTKNKPNFYDGHK